MLVQLLLSLLIDHLQLSMDFSLAMVQMNAAMLAAGLFMFIGLRLRMDARARGRRLAAAMLIW